jgi:RNA polymerase sigma-70 factor (ECF subfamily)
MTDTDPLSTLFAALRPRLHRYCARMAGSALDGEDIVQDALLKAAQHYDADGVQQPQAWLFRIAHNTALDFLRRRSFERGLFAAEPVDGFAEEDEPVAPADQLEIAEWALRTFARLPVSQRSAVILVDVLGYEAGEAGTLLDTTVAAVKSLLHRGRGRLRDIGSLDEVAAALAPGEEALVQEYARRFNARDFDGLRDMLAEGVRLDLVARHRLQGRKQVGSYFGNYAAFPDIRVRPVAVEGKSAILVDPGAGDGAARQPYVVIFGWDGQRGLASIRDFRYGRYVMDSLRCGKTSI